MSRSIQMKKQKLLLSICLLLLGNFIFAQSSATINEYIEKFKETAVEEMLRTGVPASITLAQGIHETSAGQSMLVLKSNNHFGIKCKSTWTGESVKHDDDAPGECFRKYNDPIDSYKDHSDFLKTGSRYAFLFNLDPMDYEGWAAGLKQAGYATNPKYPQILIKLIKDYNLQDYTLVALGKKKMPEAELWAGTKTTGPKEAIVSGPNVTVNKTVTYPQGVFKINETSVVFVQKGTSFLSIAEDHDISLHRLFDFNDLSTQEATSADQLIYLQRKRKNGATESHTVAAGETIYDIAQSEGIRLESLLKYNFLSATSQPEVGQTLYLKNEAPGMPKIITALFKKPEMVEEKDTRIAEAKQPESPVKNDFLFHVVSAKETMYSIAKRYAVTVSDLLKWNNMDTTDLRTGQELRINKSSTNATN